MNGSLRYETVEYGEEIKDKLYDVDASDDVFACHITVPTATAKVILDFYLERMRGEHAYELANKDRIYRTTGRLSRAGDHFPVDVIIRYGTDDTPERKTRATISISEEMNRIIAENRY